MASTKSGIGIVRILFAISITLLTVSVVLLLRYLSTADERALKNFDSAAVFVAVSDIPRGTSLLDAQASDLIEVKSYPVSSLPASSIQKIDSSNQSLVALSDLYPGQILTVELFGVRPITQIGLDIPIGHVALTLELSYAAHVASFIKPGVNVAVFATTLAENNRDAESKLLFDSLQILAIGNQVGDTAPESTDETSTFLTLAVEFNEVDKLLRANEISKLHLALLSPISSNLRDSSQG